MVRLYLCKGTCIFVDKEGWKQTASEDYDKERNRFFLLTITWYDDDHAKIDPNESSLQLCAIISQCSSFDSIFSESSDGTPFPKNK